MSDLFSSITLPNGSALPNRICKAAMEENMCDPGQVPGQALYNLYQRWADGGAGLILSGNVMVSPDAMTGPAGVYLGKEVLDNPEYKARFEKWAKIGKSGGGQFWLQINHPGRQVYATQGTPPVSASATRVNMAGMEKLFKEARALTETEIEDIITRFADTAEAAQICGFDGVQIHSAHGYLNSQFLSPLTNLRDDKWGGPLENRARFLLEIVRAIRARVGESFGVGVKLNSADFQRGGFDLEDSKQVIQWLNAENLDVLEISGGSYESAAMIGMAADGRAQSTAEREMYFLEFAKDIQKVAQMPLMVTGGVTKKETAEAALATGDVDIVGIARAMAYNMALPNDWKAGKNLVTAMAQPKFKKKELNAGASMSMTKDQLILAGKGKGPNLKISPILSLIRGQIKAIRQAKRYRKWLAGL